LVINLILREEVKRINELESLPIESIKKYVGEKVFEIVGNDSEKIKKVIKASTRNLNEFITLLDAAEEGLKKGEHQKALVSINLIIAKLKNLLAEADADLCVILNDAKIMLQSMVPSA